jgi:6-pyruvoyltetrahydropterin/6-carboxytetrahydropterin synthase
MDFGGLKEVKKYLEFNFDHTTIVAKDDPNMIDFLNMAEAGLIQLVEVDAVGCERFAEMIFKQVSTMLPAGVKLESVEVKEHAGNSAKVIADA